MPDTIETDLIVIGAGPGGYAAAFHAADKGMKVALIDGRERPGGTFFTPIINEPEVAILGVSRAGTKPVWNGKEFAPRLIMPIALSYDHRVIDGASAARFTTYLVSVLSDIRKIIL